MSTIIRRNERSWAIELISKINEISNKNDIAIKKAGGESTISTEKNHMFPDVILYGNKEQSVILQGWELKMPDVPIEDETFIKDAQRKAVALNLNSCIIWNFTYAVLYARAEDGSFEIVKQWDETSHIRTRDDVQTYRSDWEALLEKILFEINDFFMDGKFRQTLLQDAITTTTLTTLIQRNQSIISEKLKEYAKSNSVTDAYISNWWSGVKNEYEHDETDMYAAYAKTIVLNWANRITFAHIIKHKQNNARLIDSLSFDKSPSEGNKIFENITAKCDFYNVFGAVEYNDVLPELSWQDLVEYSVFLKDNGIDKLDQSMLQNILEGSVNVIKRELNGQYTTPAELAKLLVRLTVVDWSVDFLDCCCGTGTIPKAAMDIKKEKFNAESAINTVWASDKYDYPLQVANISMASADTINLANHLFKKNALRLKVGDDILLTDPSTGEELKLTLPPMGAIASNLPFVEFERLPKDDLDVIVEMAENTRLNNRSDLYCYIALKIADLLKPSGRLGIITSNSWLGTTAGALFIAAMQEKYDLLQVHISGKGRWFQNADVVTTIMILKKKDSVPVKTIQFYLWKKSLNQLKNNDEYEDKLVNSALLGKELDSTIVKLSEYSHEQMKRLMAYNISYNAFFHKVKWLEDFDKCTVPIDSVFSVFRGSRRGWDAMFYPKQGEHKIEKEYLQRVLMNARSVDYLIAKPDQDAFCCNLDEARLLELNHTGAYEWINRFKSQKNGVGKPLPDVLKRKGMHWYTLEASEIAELFTMMNPDQRLFFARFAGEPAFVNQRLIGLTRIDKHDDIELCHALLNSVLTMFSIEASGFGRGLGVLDINKDSLARCRMFNPKLISDDNRKRILTSFKAISERKIKKVIDELSSSDRLDFERTVFSAFGVEKDLDLVIESLKSLQQTRATVKDKE